MTDIAPSIRPLTAEDAPALASLNDAAHPAVPITSADELRALLGHAALALGLERDGELVGFVIAMAPGSAYDSENYRFFEARGTGHLYVDRIVVAENERGRGLGPVLYEAVFAEARRRGLPEVTCEVNLDPPNPGSLAFHARLGFAQVGTQATKGGTVTVALLAAPVA
ncbi:GNAT family N-acetyltransferase [Microcella alkalica]|uniref:GNAT family N-acetyltransferase n=1 Tax=Microcella alkalica TaxID=355930 RepID=UPI002948B997|nr:GNAT family N-acetyltransferase [Microcella alkalica]